MALYNGRWHLTLWQLATCNKTLYNRWYLTPMSWLTMYNLTTYAGERWRVRWARQAHDGHLLPTCLWWLWEHRGKSKHSSTDIHQQTTGGQLFSCVWYVLCGSGMCYVAQIRAMWLSYALCGTVMRYVTQIRAMWLRYVLYGSDMCYMAYIRAIRISYALWPSCASTLCILNKSESTYHCFVVTIFVK